MNDRVRLRIRFSKLGKIRWTSHRDLARMWERAFRRVDLPLAYSEGFTPRPRVSFGLALPTGHESVAEFLDVELTGIEGVDLAALGTRLSAALPVGVDATAVAVLAPGSPSLQEDVTSCSWRWTAAAAEGAERPQLEEVRLRVASVLAAPSTPIARNRKGVERVEDIRPGILGLEVVEESEDGVVLSAELAAAPRAVRPADVIAALGPGLEERHVRRTNQWILRHGARREPLDVAPDDAPAVPHALERAS
ncbi:MAG TPA: TIGR03936 family radical SAM-associated protein [Acidimicrobiales bacterium]|nr:TIGR03936 family radical SAM-associated protein [Acidimicrobiales bacterium]